MTLIVTTIYDIRSDSAIFEMLNSVIKKLIEWSGDIFLVLLSDTEWPPFEGTDRTGRQPETGQT